MAYLLSSLCSQFSKPLLPFKTLTALSALVLVITACGGGGGGGTTAPSASTNPPNTTPTITSTPTTPATETPTPSPNSDSTPDSFSFNEANNVALDAVITSNEFTVNGIDVPTAISITGGEYAVDGGTFTSDDGSVENGQTIQVHTTSSSQFSTRTVTTLTVGSVSADFAVTTLEHDITPDTFSFPPAVDVAPNSWVVSDPITITGVNGDVPFVVEGGEYSLDGGETYASDIGILFNGQTIQLRHTSSLLTNTETVTTLIVGMATENFTSTTHTPYVNTLPQWVNSIETLPASTIQSEVDGTKFATTADFDGDGDIDVLSFSTLSNTISWFENAGSPEQAYIEHIISSDPFHLKSVTTADVDGDGDLDVLSASWSDDTIAWYENNGSTTPSFTQHIISNTVEGAESVTSADIDGDGDLDVVSASSFDNTIAWFENDGGADPIFTKQIITSAAEWAKSVATADVDGDGDVDVVSASRDNSTIAWYENDGGAEPQFAENIISTTATGASYVSTGDIDSDGDLDVLVTTHGNDPLIWYKNDGAPDPVFSQQAITTSAISASFVTTADMDGDGDLDILSAHEFDDTVMWHENDGGFEPVFVEHKISTTALGAKSVATADIDGDGDLDVLSASDPDGTIAWYRSTQRSYWVAEGSNLLAIENAIDTDGNILTYGIVGGPDAQHYAIDATTGEITFDNAPLSAAPEDSNGDNVYEVWVSVSDGFSTLNRSVAMRVYVDDEDDDNDGIPDADDSFPFDPAEWLDNDNDGQGNNADSDDDNDGVPDNSDNAPFDASSIFAPQWLEEVQEPTQNVISTAAEHVVSVTTADIDGDGDLDVLSASFWDDTIAWYENDGGANPVFTEHIISITAVGVESVATADIDGDGDLDVLSASSRDSTIAWYENDGSAEPMFTKRSISTSALGAWSVTTTDIDGDGDIDVLSASHGDDTIAWYENDGGDDPLFTEHEISTSAQGATSVTAADIDGDGDTDVLSASADDDTIAWYENDGGADPEFTEHNINTTAGGATSVTTADIDGDGDLDVLSSSFRDDTIAWYENNGGANPVFAQHSITTTANGAESVATADIDGDGDIDVLSASSQDNSITWFENDGAAAPKFTKHSISTTSDGAIVVATADIDDDGDLEILSASSGDDTIAWYRTTHGSYWVVQGNPLATFESASDADFNLLTYAIAGGPDAIHFTIDAASGELIFADAPPEDANGDNIYEVWISVSDGFSTLNRAVAVRIYEANDDEDNDGVTNANDAFPLDPTEWLDTDSDGQGNNSDSDDDNDGEPDANDNAPLEAGNSYAPKWLNDVQSPIKIPIASTADEAQSVVTADMDGDGDLDVLLASSGDDTIAWYENDGSTTPSFTQHIISNTANGAKSVTSADIDGDGDLDVVSASYDDDTIAWYENDGSADPTFTQHIISNTAEGAQSVTTADMDGDGDLDVLSASWTDNTLAWYENDGSTDPLFTEHTVTTEADGARSVTAADMDGDGDLDLLSASILDSTISWYENNGLADPLFTKHDISTETETRTAGSIIASDLDGDGDLDVLSTTFGLYEIAWYENKGGPNPLFTRRDINTEADLTDFVTTADMDGDGDLDVLSASAFNGRIDWHENYGGANPLLPQNTILISGEGARSVAVGDLDGDGDLDMLSASEGDDPIAWYRNTQRSYFVAEGSTLVVTENASDADDDPLTYALAGGPDSLQFSINTGTGEITFANAPLTSAPEDANGDNVYEVWVSVSDGFSTLHRAVAVSVIIDDEDDDSDGVLDVNDAFLFDPSEWLDTDSDGLGNNSDRDDDNDGVLDAIDNSPLDASSGLAPEWLNDNQTAVVNTISATANGAHSVTAADVDGDGDTDVISASADDNTIAWYESDGSFNPIFLPAIISTTASGAYSISIADVDGDGDLDLLSASRDNDTIAWHENNGGTDPIFTEHAISTMARNATSVTSADIDGDGDLDVLSTSESGSNIAWYENNGSNDPVFNEHVISTTADGAQSVTTADLDGDGDLDVVSASEWNQTIAWYENNGSANPVFTEHAINTTALGAKSVTTADMDGDGDLDVLSASYQELAWYENDGSANPAFTVHIISTKGANAVATADMDGDGDLDVLSALYFDNTIIWHENQGSAQLFFIENIITTNADGASSVTTADIDADGDLDVLTASYDDNTIAWYPTTQRNHSVNEGNTLVVTENASDAEGNTLTYDIVSGPDAMHFSIDSATGDLTFADAPLRSAPEDANGDNVYEVWISVSDGFSTLNRSIAVEVVTAL